MKHQLRDLIILFISLSGLSYLYRAYLRRRGPLVRILCFHDVADAVWFEKVIKMISENYQLLTPEAFKSKKFSPEKINILLTFDDGYQSWIDNCLPVLTKYNAKGIFFINSGLLDIAEDDKEVEEYMRDRLLILPKKALTWQGVKQLVEAGQTIGGHTISHFNLAALDVGEAEKEIVVDKAKIQSVLGITLEDFAYPFGTSHHISTRLINLVHAIYPYQYSAVTGFIKINKDQLIPRTLIDRKPSMSQIKSWIGGGYDLFAHLIGK